MHKILPRPDQQNCVRQLNGSHHNSEFGFLAPAGYTLDDLLPLGVFDGVVGPKVRDTIEVVAADLSFTATLRVVAREKDGSGTAVRVESSFVEDAIAAGDFQQGDLEIKFSGDPKIGWAIYVLGERNKPVRDGFATAGAAVSALKAMTSAAKGKPAKQAA